MRDNEGERFLLVIRIISQHLDHSFFSSPIDNASGFPTGQKMLEHAWIPWRPESWNTTIFQPYTYRIVGNTIIRRTVFISKLAGCLETLHEATTLAGEVEALTVLCSLDKA